MSNIFFDALGLLDRQKGGAVLSDDEQITVNAAMIGLDRAEVAGLLTGSEKISDGLLQLGGMLERPPQRPRSKFLGFGEVS